MEIRMWLRLADLSRIPSGTFFREVRPVSELGYKYRKNQLFPDVYTLHRAPVGQGLLPPRPVLSELDPTGSQAKKSTATAEALAHLVANILLRAPSSIQKRSGLATQRGGLKLLLS